ncbi:MAG: AAA family ATPase [Candidatus Bathyarchaeia archaeon]
MVKRLKRKIAKKRKRKPLKSVRPKRKQLDFSVFYEDYTPPKLVVRDKQVTQIKQTMDNFIKNGIAPNLLLTGVTGSGKTATLQYVLNDYNKKSYTFVRCKQMKGIKEVLAYIGNMKPLTRQRAPELLPKVIENLKKERKAIVLDDVTVIPSWVELLGYMDGIYRAVQSPVIVTTNMFRFLDNLPDDVRHTLLFFRVDFPAYNALELFRIIKDRVKLSGTKIPDGSLRLIGALASDVGSARDALVMTRTGIELGKTKEIDIQELHRTIEEQTYRDYIGRLAPKERLALEYILRQYNATKTPIPIREITKNLRLSPSRTSQLVTSLEQYDIITTQIQYSKEGGKFRTIQPDDWLVERVAKGEIEV